MTKKTAFSIGWFGLLLLLLPVGFSAERETPTFRAKSPAKLLKAREKLPMFNEILTAIEKGQKWLFAQQNADGTWKKVGNPEFGNTSLCALALIKSGISNTDPRIVKTVKHIEANGRIPKKTYGTTSLLMLLEAYGRVYKRGKAPKGPGILYGSPTEASEKKEFTYDPKIKAWMEDLVAALEEAGAQFETRWAFPERKSDKEISKRLGQIERSLGGKKSKRKSKLYGKPPKKGYTVRGKGEFKIWRWRYDMKPITERTDWDNSVQQYIYLGLKAAQRAGITVKNKDLWYGALLHWLETQVPTGNAIKTVKAVDKRKNKDVDPYALGDLKGVTYQDVHAQTRGWVYYESMPKHSKKQREQLAKLIAGKQGTPTLTPAGITASLLIRSVLFKEVEYLAYFEDATEQSITDAFAWIDANWKEYTDTYPDMRWGLYAYYGIERVGVFAGTEFIGKHAWYKELARLIIDHQDSSGYFHSAGGHEGGAEGEERQVNTAFALMFLARGSEPMPEVPKPRMYQISAD